MDEGTNAISEQTEGLLASDCAAPLPDRVASLASVMSRIRSRAASTRPHQHVASAW